MNCKYCNAELPEDVTACPACGKEQAEEIAEEIAAETVEQEEIASVEEIPSEADVEVSEEEETEELPKTKTRKTTTTVIACILLGAIVIGLFAGIFGGKANTAPAEPTEATTVVIPSSGDPASALCKAGYTVSDEEAIAAADVVVATMGDKTLTNGELQAYYWQEIYMFLEENYSYASYMGLDLNQPLGQQLMSMGETALSWEQFFLDSTIASWKNYQALALEAEAAGHKMPAERQEELDTMAAGLDENAVNNGFKNADELVRFNVGVNCTKDDYINHVNTYFQSMSYYQDYCENLNPSDAEIEAYYAENEDAFVGSGITKEAKFVDVRHVLLMPENGQTGENGYPVYTDEAWEACRKEAEELYNKWQEGDKSEVSFAQLAMEHSVDGSASNGGLCESVAVGDMVSEFNDWCFDESRQSGDHGLVKTVYGYHIMFFSAHRNWYDFAKIDLLNQLSYEMIPAAVEKHPATVDFSLIELAEINFG